MSVYSRLTDTNTYTGAHKHKFDENGQGRGKAGRDTGVDGISDLSQITRPELNKGQTTLCSVGGGCRPSQRPSGNTTQTTPRQVKKSSGSSIYDRLTDSSTYTGAHKYKFDENGKGLGKAGRDTGRDGISDLSQITRPEMHVGPTGLDSYKRSQQSINPDVGISEPTPKPRVKKSSGPSIYDRLTDTSTYTGTHQHRFDENGQGRGKAGRDTGVDGINDLSQITRPEMRVGPTGLDSYNKSQADYSRTSTQSSQGAATNPRKTTSKGPSIYDRLTDSSTYTGAHKHKFDENGNGRGRAGRDTGVDGIKDLSQITRPDMK